MSANQKLINVNIAFRNTEATEAIKSYATDKLTHCVQKFGHDEEIEVHLVFTVEKNRHIAEVTLRTDGADFVAKQESDDLYTSIDAIVDSLSNQLRKHKEKLTKHH
jgi:putative sigma-54 modulation protein